MTIREFINFLGYAKRSCVETRSHIYDALDEKYISEKEFDELTDQAMKIASMLAKLIHHLQSLNPDMKRTFTQSRSIPTPISGPTIAVCTSPTLSPSA